MKRCVVCGWKNSDVSISCEKCGFPLSKDAQRKIRLENNEPMFADYYQKEFICEDCGCVCSTSTLCRVCGSTNVKVQNVCKSHIEKFCNKCGYVTHLHEDFIYCPICGNLLENGMVYLLPEEEDEIPIPSVDKCIPMLETESYVVLPHECFFEKELLSNQDIPYSLKKIIQDLFIAKAEFRPAYGIVDREGNVVVDFIYDKINSFQWVCLPSPGPLPPIDMWFIGAFFHQGNNVGYLRLYENQTISEYGKMSQEKWKKRSMMT